MAAIPRRLSGESRYFARQKKLGALQVRMDGGGVGTFFLAGLSAYSEC